MINGAHALLYSRDPDADRAFFRDVLDLRSEEGTEARLHSGSELLGAILYFMCDDLPATIQRLAARRVSCTPVSTEPRGHRTTIPLPSGGEVGLDQPTHATALDLPRSVG